MSRRSSMMDQGRYGTQGKSRRPDFSDRYNRYRRSSSQNGQQNVLCDFCLAKKMRAVKSCLTCLTSFCETHLRAHYEYPALMKHKLVTATGQLREKICAEHDKLLEVFCRSDQRCVCVLCIMEEHKKHDTVTAAAERTEKQKELGVTLMTSQQKIEERVKKWQDLRQAAESLKHSSQSLLEENDRIFTELIQALERRHADVKEMVRTQEVALLTQAERHQGQMEEEITLLRMKHNDLEKLSHSEDHIHFLQSWQALTGPSGYEDLSKTALVPQHTFDKAKKAISDLKVQLEDVSKEELSKISHAVRDVQILQTVHPKTREEFLQYSCNLSLDPLTTHPNLHLSKVNTMVQMSSDLKQYPENLERFDYWQQVLCREVLSASRCYWEVEWTGTEADIAVTYKNINRKGNDNACSFGWNDKSWSLYCSESKYSFIHNSKRTTIPVPSSSKIAVYVDHSAGTLAFYSVSDTMTLLHKVHTSFIQPIYAGFGVWGYGTTLRIL
ncbi:tripartite motif-containing protein 16 [Electrophorus electricus]|uniref:tripartite motif-containing protein 16 n=1 Tax=Electrophorus electricus TaxID=8005 RepID=UPI0015D0A98E|nr:tripartite motif-containing protein 16 [Electrophorus electricus]